MEEINQRVFKKIEAQNRDILELRTFLALWSPRTTLQGPKKVINQPFRPLEEKNVNFHFDARHQ